MGCFIVFFLNVKIKRGITEVASQWPYMSKGGIKRRSEKEGSHGGLERWVEVSKTSDSDNRERISERDPWPKIIRDPFTIRTTGESFVL